MKIAVSCMRSFLLEDFGEELALFYLVCFVGDCGSRVQSDCVVLFWFVVVLRSDVVMVMISV